jgi:bifunctional non-homologous end joining protein LigD
MAVPAPMLASPAGELPPLIGWTIEPKWDGIRVIADVTPKRAALWSRNHINKAHEFPALVAALMTLAERTGPVVLDGELVAIDAKGKPLRFQALQARNTAGSRTALVVFDLLSAAGHSWTAQPWTERRKALELIVPKASRALVRRGETGACGSKSAARILEAARHDGWEGLILKRMDARYESGKRSRGWRKVKLEHEQEFVIGGYTRPTEGVVRELGALLVGYHDEAGDLRYAGKVGTGYTRKTLELLGKKLAPLVQTAAPFVEVPKAGMAHAVWVKPTLVAQVKYNEMTASGVLRQPSYLGLRDDKEASDVRLEPDTSSEAILDALDCGA